MRPNLNRTYLSRCLSNPDIHVRLTSLKTHVNDKQSGPLPSDKV